MGLERHASSNETSPSNDTGRRRSRSVTYIDVPEPKRGRLASDADGKDFIVIDTHPKSSPTVLPASPTGQSLNHANVVKFFRMKPNAIGYVSVCRCMRY